MYVLQGGVCKTDETRKYHYNSKESQFLKRRIMRGSSSLSTPDYSWESIQCFCGESSRSVGAYRVQGSPKHVPLFLKTI